MRHNDPLSRMLVYDADSVLIEGDVPAVLPSGWRKRLNPDADFGESMTVQSDFESTDINSIVRRFHKGEPLPVIDPGQYGDVSEVGSFEELQERMLRFDAYFYQLPAELRAKFGNDGAVFADWIVDRNNVEEARSLGLIEPDVPPVAAEPPAPPPAP